MTEEELKNIEQTTALLVENGLVIKNTDNFIREIGNTNLNDIINKLNARAIRMHPIMIFKYFFIFYLFILK